MQRRNVKTSFTCNEGWRVITSFRGTKGNNWELKCLFPPHLKKRVVYGNWKMENGGVET